MKRLIAALSISVLLGSCATNQPEPAPTSKPSSERTLSCIFYSDREAKVFGEFKGQQVGFCCSDCEAQWDGLLDKKKDRLNASYER